MCAERLKEQRAGADLGNVERRSGMTRSLKLSALVSLIAYASGAAAYLWRSRSAR
jgi:hypothetical protein